MVTFLDTYGEVYGVEPICQVLRDTGLPIAPSTYYAARNRRPSTRAVRDDELCHRIQATYDANYRVYGARKIWRQLRRDGEQVARCTVERLMRRLGIQGARCGKTPRTTRSDPALPKPADLLRRDFTATAPNTRWVADYTYVPIEGQTVYVAFVIDLYSRAIVGWRLAEHQRTDLPLDALTMALWQRRPDRDALIHHSDHGSFGGFNRWSQHPSGGVERWVWGCGRSRFGSIGGRCRRRDGRRWRGVRIGSRSGPRSVGGR
ncbi:IS3 family transposase [Dactylosporangium sp. NPDC051484]|uniref:IS3 family transposase n=1 Tax=Dactylosporangium sp. NPDC051484 TaxID=3154942 RepID=UPI00344BFA80